MKIEDGDIICFQKSTSLGSEGELKYSNVPSFLTRLKKEQEEEDKKRYKAQAHLYTTIKVARDEDLVKQIGGDIYFDLVDHDKVRSFTIKKQTAFNLFKGLVAL
ncbi:ubiquitin C-terminal hydrolase 12-like isoform X1 [Malus sylvestris]|uniref:ubiquitin C-terminal hydrolase 12-like n=1 Tax=Malus domestica TaxID=3750 RepID=UPI0004990528|nr:ubiquitin carboxyl-terminal hydrolase 12-like isoform X5 [Malus domestica]XP_050114583.1 ubiquitin C-terminal hydrolase 12-like isoform X1 [Malus sylvestris]XP_050114584.1 ubiquitin C-terminal hydrolase 12-like isoform X1 [Malus sylvestris]XP_050114585.1 ubiquitin C-terminal hydrolase 12-like isoform X1 [Malus sylvestris]